MIVEDETTLCAEACGLAVARVRELAEFAQANGLPLVGVLLDKGKVDERVLLSGLGTLLGLPFADQNGTQIPADVLAQVSPALATRYQVMPLKESGGRLQIACSDP